MVSLPNLESQKVDRAEKLKKKLEEEKDISRKTGDGRKMVKAINCLENPSNLGRKSSPEYFFLSRSDTDGRTGEPILRRLIILQHQCLKRHHCFCLYHHCLYLP